MPTFEVNIAAHRYTVKAAKNGGEAISLAIKQVRESAANDLHAGILDWVQVVEIPERGDK